MRELKYHPTNEILEVSMVLYQIKNTITNNSYVGYTTRKLEDRIKQHLGCHSKSASSDCYNRTKMYEDFKKFGLENFTLSILGIFQTKKELINAEKLLQNQKDFKYYNERNAKKDTTKKHSLKKICLTDAQGIKQYFKSPIEVAKIFKCHRSNVTKAIKGQYLLKRKYKVEYIK